MARIDGSSPFACPGVIALGSMITLDSLAVPVSITPAVVSFRIAAWALNRFEWIDERRNWWPLRRRQFICSTTVCVVVGRGRISAFSMLPTHVRLSVLRVHSIECIAADVEWNGVIEEVEKGGEEGEAQSGERFGWWVISLLSLRVAAQIRQSRLSPRVRCKRIEG